jgi:uncharacterized protein (DUF433 family)
MATDYPHVSSDPAVCEGRPCVLGSQVRVTEIASALEGGRSVFDLQEFFRPQKLTLAEIYSALAYYHDNKDELLRVQAADKVIADEAERLRLDKIKRYYLGQ